MPRNLTSALTLCTTIFLFPSSATAAEQSCSNIRQEEIYNFAKLMDSQLLALRGHETKILALRQELNLIDSQLKLKNFSLDFNTEYKNSLTGFDAPDHASTKYSEQNITVKQVFSASKIREKKINAARKAVTSLKLSRLINQHRIETVKKILEIKKLKEILSLTEAKLPLIQEKIEYYTLLGDLSADGFRQLAEAELSKIKLENEISNLQSRIILESDSFVGGTGTIKNINYSVTSELVYQTVNLISPCNFYDKETELQNLEIKLAREQVKQARESHLPSVSFSSRLSSRDYHSGAHKNNFSVGAGVSFPLFDGGHSNAEVQESLNRLRYLEQEAKDLRENHRIKYKNLLTIELTIIASIRESREKIIKLKKEISELQNRGNFGQTVFEQLVTKKLQKTEIMIIVVELRSRLRQLWADHWENLIAS